MTDILYLKLAADQAVELLADRLPTIAHHVRLALDALAADRTKARISRMHSRYPRRWRRKR